MEHRTTRYYAKIADDELAMQNLRELRKSKKFSNSHERLRITSIVGLSESAIYRAMKSPENCTTTTYAALASVMNWEKYQSGRKLPPSRKQGVIPFSEFMKPKPETKSSYDLRVMISPETLSALQVIADTVQEPLKDVVELGLKLYVKDCRRVLDYHKEGQ